MKNITALIPSLAGATFVIAAVTAGSLVATPEPIAPEVAPVATVQEVTAEGSTPAPERDSITVETPAPEVVAPVAPVVSEPAPEVVQDTPAICEPGLLLVEDGSCVDPSFFADPTAPVSEFGPTYSLSPCLTEDGAGAYACYWDAQTRGNGEGRSFVLIGGTIFYAQG